MFSCNRKTIFEDLSAELFFEIFDYFHFIELYNTFSNLNRRIDNYLAQLSNICLNICPRKYELTTKLNEKQVLCVRSIKFDAWRDEDQHKIQDFLIEYPLKLFRKLHSLTLRPIISSTELPIIIDQLPLLSYLTCLNITFHLYEWKLTADELQHAHETIFRRCVTLKTLKFTIMDYIDSRKSTHNKPLFTQPIITKIEYLNMYKLYIDEFDCILSPSFLSRVKSLTASIYYDPQQKNFLNEGLPLDSLVNLQLHIDFGITFPSLESILKRTPNLKILVFSSSPVTFIDCQKWQYLLSKYLLKVEAFHLHACDWEDRQWAKETEYTDFQTSTYWLTERRGVVQSKCKQVWDEDGSEIDSISVTFTTITYKSWNGKCSYCYRYRY